VKLAQKILRFIDRAKEDERREFRQCVAMTQAHAIDVDRTIVKMNGHAHEFFTDLKPPKQ
jgi:hypothetical protein